MRRRWTLLLILATGSAGCFVDSPAERTATTSASSGSTSDDPGRTETSGADTTTTGGSTTTSTEPPAPDSSTDGGDDTDTDSTTSESNCGNGPPGMICIFAGEFLRGSADAGSPADEQPQATLYLDEFEIDQFEVTSAEYTACVDAGECSEPFDSFGDGSDCNWNRPGLDDHPINCVDWFQASDYCDFVGKRLPTEAEWEKAARGVDGRTHPWGEAPPSCDLAVMNDGGLGCGTGTPTLPVGSRSPDSDSPYGLADAAGNVWEWVDDWYGADYYPSAPASNPPGPGDGRLKVIRGGGWVNDNGVTSGLRMADRTEGGPTSGSTAIGIRCARTP